jgi:hypothetical protein
LPQGISTDLKVRKPALESAKAKQVHLTGTTRVNCQERSYTDSVTDAKTHDSWCKEQVITTEENPYSLINLRDSIVRVFLTMNFRDKYSQDNQPSGKEGKEGRGGGSEGKAGEKEGRKGGREGGRKEEKENCLGDQNTQSQILFHSSLSTTFFLYPRDKHGKKTKWILFQVNLKAPIYKLV